MDDFDRFAKFYDLDYGQFREDLPLYLAFAQRTGSPVLEVGCGTGRVLLSLAQAGYRATGVDRSPAMLAVARSKIAAAKLTRKARLLEADARAFQLADRFALAIVAVNSFMLFLTLDDQLLALERIAAHLRPGGLLVVDLFNPDVSALREAAGVLVHEYTREDPSTGRCVTKFALQHVDIAEQRVDATFIYDELDGAGHVTRAMLPFSSHYFWRRELALLFERAGFQVERVYGSYDLEDYTDGSPRMIAVAVYRGDGERSEKDVT